MSGWWVCLLGDGITDTKGFSSSDIVPFLVSWVTRNKGMSKENRAAIFFVANAAMEQHIQRFAEDPAVRDSLGAVGATFQYAEIEHEFVYIDDWLRAAWQVGPETEPGRAAFLLLLDQSFDLGCCCPGGPIRTALAFRVANAWKDKVAVAFGDNLTGTPDESDVKMALRYYREVIASTPNTDEGMKAQTYAWRIPAGAKSLETTFVCLYN
jgi:hypothetical protein